MQSTAEVSELFTPAELQSANQQGTQPIRPKPRQHPRALAERNEFLERKLLELRAEVDDLRERLENAENRSDSLLHLLSLSLDSHHKSA